MATEATKVGRMSATDPLSNDQEQIPEGDRPADSTTVDEAASQPTGRDTVAAPVTQPGGMLPSRSHRRYRVEQGAMRLIATIGVIAVATALGAILVSQDVAGWIVGLAVGLTSVILAAVLWSSREL